MPFLTLVLSFSHTLFPLKATVNPDHIASEAGSKMEHLSDHKFEVRVVVYRQGGQLHAFPSIAKVARAAFDPTDPHPDKGSLINNITTSSKETAQSGSYRD